MAVDATTGVLDAAARLTALHGMRACDAVQLASALAAAGADPELRSFAAFDVSRRAAAAAEGLELLPA